MTHLTFNSHGVFLLWEKMVLNVFQIALKSVKDFCEGLNEAMILFFRYCKVMRENVIVEINL